MRNVEGAGRWLDLGLLALAAFLRLAWLELKPPHFDEGVNGWFVDGMTRTGFYHYDPTNFHGPLHYYVLFVAQTLLGRHVWALRLPLALVSLACVAFALFGFRRFFSAGVCRLAALVLAISPGMVFFGRYAIHESWQVLFEMLAVCGLAGLWREGRARDLWAAGLGLTGMILTKETWLIHALAMALTFPALWLLERLSPSAPCALSSRRWTWDDLARVSAVGIALVVFFYSGCLLDPGGLRGIADTYLHWLGTGTRGESGHEKEWWYWLQLLGIYEWPLLLGLAAGALCVLPRVDRAGRWLAIAGAGTLTAYSLIAYKTPWCLISIVWPFAFVFALAVVRGAALVDRWAVGAAAGVVCLCSLAQCVALNFRHDAGSDEQPDEAEPYVYVQTRRDVNLLLDPLRWLVARDPAALHRRGHVIQPEHHPLLWLLGDFTRVTFDEAEGDPQPMDADWLLVDATAVDRVEEQLRGEYFKTSLQLRGMAPDRSTLYLRAGTFREFFPGRDPEFISAEAALLRELEPAK